VWVHGDWAYVDEDGFWFIHGRSDDTLKIAGKRVGPAEVESVLVGHPAVNEAAAVGVPHEVKGESVVCFAVLRPGQTPGDALRGELTDRVLIGLVGCYLIGACDRVRDHEFNVPASPWAMSSIHSCHFPLATNPSTGRSMNWKPSTTR
jgi:acyl-CoA synthetase (AMP-forming)/AMP-acid ligase II